MRSSQVPWSSGADPALLFEFVVLRDSLKVFVIMNQGHIFVAHCYNCDEAIDHISDGDSFSPQVPVHHSCTPIIRMKIMRQTAKRSKPRLHNEVFTRTGTRDHFHDDWLAVMNHNAVFNRSQQLVSTCRVTLCEIDQD